ncbi:MAG: DUF2232 domain-containing protein [Pseudanabaenaceae cyanobacterium]
MSRPPLALVETAFLASATAVMFFINNNFPILLVRNLYPLPVVLVWLRWGGRSAVIAVTVATLLVMVLMGPVRSTQYLILFGGLGLLLGYLWQRGVRWGMSLALSTGLMVLGTAVELILLSLLFGENIWSYSVVQATGFVNWLLQQVGSLEQADLLVVELVAVGGVILRNLIYVTISHVLAWLIFDRLQIAIPAPPKWLANFLEL